MVLLQRYNHIVLLSLSVVSLLSCTPDRNNNMTPLTIIGGSITGASPSGAYEIVEYIVDQPSNTIIVEALPSEFNYAAGSLSEVDALWASVIYGELHKKVSAAEAFAYERITERTQRLALQYNQYRNQLLKKEGYDEVNTRSAFIYAYVRGTPSVKANDVLFGQPAGSDLSEWFCFGDKNIISVIGPEFIMEEKADAANEYQSASEYFTPDKMLPYTIQISTKGIPDEVIPKSIRGIYHEENETVKVAITVPVLYERYWEWCKALYSNPEAVKEVVYTEIRIVIPFIRKQK